jgi:hypothetical protein
MRKPLQEREVRGTVLITTSTESISAPHPSAVSRFVRHISDTNTSPNDLASPCAFF